MAAVHYERLSFLDSTFLAMEDRNSHFHVAGVMVFEPGNVTTDDGTVDVDRIRAFIGSRLHHIPRYRQVLAWTPIDDHPVWVDDDHFDIGYHVRHTSLPAPGGPEELKTLAARIFSTKLDRWRPLWEVWIVEGLADGGFAMIPKVHHCMIDGVAGVDLLSHIMNFYPDDTFEPGPAWEPRPAPTATKLFRDEMARRASTPFQIVRSGLKSVASGPRALVQDIEHRAKAASTALSSGWLHNASETPLNPRIGPNRLFDWLDTDLESVKKVKNVLGGTVNDVLLATVAGAVRRYLLDHDFPVEDLDFRAMAPVSVRTSDQQGDLGNQVAMWLLDLPVGEADPAARLQGVQERTVELKETDQALGAMTIVQAGSWMPTTLLSLAARLVASGARPFNLTVTNVPGPQIPIYLLSARMKVHYPMVPLWVNHGVGVALFSYDGAIAWGINSDAEGVPDVDRFVAAIGASFDELLQEARYVSGEATRPGSRAKKRAPARRKPAAAKKAAKPAAKKTAKPAAKKTAKPAAKKTAKPAARKTSKAATEKATSKTA